MLSTAYDATFSHSDLIDLLQVVAVLLHSGVLAVSTSSTVTFYPLPCKVSARDILSYFDRLSGCPCLQQNVVTVCTANSPSSASFQGPTIIPWLPSAKLRMDRTVFPPELRLIPQYEDTLVETFGGTTYRCPPGIAGSLSNITALPATKHAIQPLRSRNIQTPKCVARLYSKNSLYSSVTSQPCIDLVHNCRVTKPRHLRHIISIIYKFLSPRRYQSFGHTKRL